MKFFKNIVWVLLLGASFVAQAMCSSASSSGASSSADDSSAELTHEESDFLLHYDGGEIPADKQELINSVLRKLPIGQKWTNGPVLHEHGFVTALAFSPDGTKLASGGNDRIIRVLDVNTGTVSASSEPLSEADFGQSAHIGKLLFAPDGINLASCIESRSYQLWHINGVQLKVLVGNEL